MPNPDLDTELSHGFAAGNYANAYETENLEVAMQSRRVFEKSEAYRTACILGFDGSYELHEIPAVRREEFDEAYHSDYGARLLELGYSGSRKKDYANEQG